jgi:hypothetical protein
MPPDAFPVKRIAVTVPPPDDWFQGIARAIFNIYRAELVSMGFEIFDVPVDLFHYPDAGSIGRLLSELRAFRPEIAIGLPKGIYAMMCRMPARWDGSRPNLFTDVLDIPTICLWDHAPLDLADQLVYSENPAATSGARELLRRVWRHPRIFHWLPDTGQTRIMQELDWLLPAHVIQETLPALPGFEPQESTPEPGVSFVGHFYKPALDFPDPALNRLAEELTNQFLSAPDRPLWYSLLNHPGAPHPDQPTFWVFANRLIIEHAQAAQRLQVLGSAGVPVVCYGNLKTGAPGVPANLIPKPAQIPFGPELARTLARHTLTIDVFNPGSISGYSHKPMLAFASGGFMLVDRKPDFIAAFGEAGEAVSYHRDLAAKIDRFLTDPAYLREVGDEIRDTIRTRFQLRHVLTRVINTAIQLAETTHPPHPQIDSTHTVANLLPALRSLPHWTGATTDHTNAGAEIYMPPRAWQYCAEIPIPPLSATLRQPQLRLHLQVKSGRIGVSVLRAGGGPPRGEQFVAPSPLPVTLTLPLPPEPGAIVIFRNAVDADARVLVLSAALCDIE